ncbi:MAG: squalene--hopene cyclase [Solirubrobacteraceae bacterium]
MTLTLPERPPRERPEPAATNAAAPERVDRAADALRRGREHLLALQRPDGHWRAELQTNVAMDAEDVMLRELLGIREREMTERSARWIRSQQRDDGSWATFHGGPGDLSITVEAYVALRLAGDEPQEPHMLRASAFVRAQGGIERTRVFTRIWLAMLGAWSWTRLPLLPPELMLAPPWVPLNVYDFACWARQTVVALTIVLTYRPTRPLPFSLAELHGAQPWRRPTATTRGGRALLALDRGLTVYHRLIPRRLREPALARAERWIVERQEQDGSWGGIQPPWVYSLLALALRGYGLDHPAMARGLAGLETFAIEEGATRRMEACQSPVWDTALAVLALSDAGLPADDPSLVRAADWLLEQQVLGRGDWAIRRPDLAPGGWAFEYANVNYPDVDDTAVVALALSLVDHPERDRSSTAIDRGITWTEGMRSRDGGWGAFDADNCRGLARDLPFCDFGEVIDPPSADVTAHAVEMLAALGRGGGAATRDGVRWLLAAQDADGSWFGRWGANRIYGTGAVLPALARAGVSPEHPAFRRAVAWLEAHQNDDGGWGEDLRSYRDPAWIGRGTSTASQTAWALLALDAAGERSEAVTRGVDWLVDRQLADGGWDEPQFTGTGFPGDFYINYHLYRDVFPVMALGRCLR